MDYRQSAIKFVCPACLILLLVVSVFADTVERYRFTCELEGAARGRILLIFPYRAFYRSRVSAIFRALPIPDGRREFSLESVDRTGIMTRTSGFSGRTLVILTLDGDMELGIRNGRTFWNEVRENVSYFPRFIQQVKDFQFRFFSSALGSIVFYRFPGGIQRLEYCNPDVRYRYHPEELRINFNLYRIMAEMTRLYNHDFRPPSGTWDFMNRRIAPGLWVSDALDFSISINSIASLASRFVAGLRDFHQEGRFRLLYSPMPLEAGTIRILGCAEPDVRIWGSFRIKRLVRRIVLDLNSGRLLKDELEARISKGTKGGMTVLAKLESAGSHPEQSVRIQNH